MFWQSLVCFGLVTENSLFSVFSDCIYCFSIFVCVEQTESLETREPLSRSPQDRTFFARPDAQLTKVNKFYKKKEAEIIARASDLEKQMLALINSQEARARQDLPIYESHLDYLSKKDSPGAHAAGDHLQSEQ